MFTRQELRAEWPRLVATGVPPLEIAEFGHQDIGAPGSEQEIWAFRGLKRDFASGAMSWVKTLQVQGWEGRQTALAGYTEAGLCEPITAADFVSLVTDYSGSLRQPLPPFLLDMAGFCGGLRMYAEWNDVAAVVELADTFVAFYWSTTA